MMSRSSTATLVALILAATIAVPNPGAAEYTKQENIVYGHKDGLGLLMDVFTPRKQNGAGVIWTVSGGMNSSRRAIPRITKFPGFRALLDKGYTLFAVMHGSQPRFALEEIVKDMPKAVRHIRFHAKRYGIDGDRLGVTGRSSAGQLSLYLATAAVGARPNAEQPIDRVSSRVQAAVAYFPGTDMVHFGKRNTTILEHFRSRGMKADATFDFHTWSPETSRFERVTDRREQLKFYRDLSPITHITPDDPPALIIHGTEDKIVPLQQGEIFQTKLKKAGVPSELFVAKGKNHGWGKPLDGELKAFTGWFDRHLLSKK